MTFQTSNLDQRTQIPPAKASHVHPSGRWVTIDGEPYYEISRHDLMRPFLMSLASDTDLWMFITSNGGLTAGRVGPEGSLFPYETVDKLHDGHHHTGPITLLRVGRRSGGERLWAPFSPVSTGEPLVERRLYKSVTGNRVIFDETHLDLNLRFQYRWSSCDEFGHVRTSTVMNLAQDPVTVSILDGLRNVLPHGAPLALYQQASCLVDAYKRVDLEPRTGLGVFSLTAKIVDRAEAAEELRANVVWCQGLRGAVVRLSAEAVAAFRRGEPSHSEGLLAGQRGNYLAVASLAVEPGARSTWHIIGDVGRSQTQIAALGARILESDGLGEEIEGALDRATDNLRRNVASADGLQLTGHPEVSAHHFANVLFNNMRGGVFAHNHDVPGADLADFVRERNRAVARRQATFLDELPSRVGVGSLISAAGRTGDADLHRLCHEYLPLYFGRRHGDPSRPWNQFSIQVRRSDGGRALRYEGNWRDIFQNWEALTLSFPNFLPSIIATFVNASTVDGFNPYRISRGGIDWEVIDPADPWSYIGYWGDHQIVYLLRLLEALSRHAPGTLEELLDQEIFCYADVPYRLVPYPEILRDPRNTIVFDADHASRIDGRVDAIGADGKLLHDRTGAIHRVSLLEKLLVPALSKLSNLVADGGIWMNTQRPEWNDANNALVGNGISMVTLAYLRRYLDFLARVLEGREERTAAVSAEVGEWSRRAHAILVEERSMLGADRVGDEDRKRLLDRMGEAFSDYRQTVYARGLSEKQELSLAQVVDLCRVALAYVDHAIAANRRPDGLYHSYNLMDVSMDDQTIAVSPLYEMLEGQVAVLSSGAVTAPEAVHLLARLFGSRLYREDQRSFLLYPDRPLPAFMERNIIHEDHVRAIPLLGQLLQAGNTAILDRDVSGVCRFSPEFRNARDVARALDGLSEQASWAEPVAAHRQAVLDVFEDVFHHRSFTGRSGTMYAYEGLGCTYWHMVSKLLLAIQEITHRAVDGGQASSVIEALARAYSRVRSGLGFEKTVAEYGAFPTDPYSHTPPDGGARQPGMTGQVKEEILTRFGELGVRVEAGRVSFRPILLTRREFRDEAGAFQFYDFDGVSRAIDIPAGALAFTFCQVPVVYELCQGEAWIAVSSEQGVSRASGNGLDADKSRALFDRRGRISRIDVGIPRRSIRRT